MLFINLLQSDWYLHLGASALLFLLIYIVNKKYLKKDLNYKSIFWQIFLANLIDLDHLLSSPIYLEGRCSINNHLFHSWYFWPLYLLGLLGKYRYFFISLIIHLLIDFLGCL